uniref:hypothetical protein n=1 Tax=Phenylobacterium sp. TaxID=1871053 RepID=UPI0035C7A5DA
RSRAQSGLTPSTFSGEDHGAPDVAGMSSTTLRATDGFTSRAAGTSIATHDIMAGLRYWRPQ